MTSTAALRITGIAGAVAILLALGLLGELLGAFGDPDHVFIDYYDDSGNGARGLLGAATLIAGGLLFLAFLEMLVRRIESEQSSVALNYTRSAGLAFVVLTLSAAAALGTVDLSRGFADLFDETERPLEGNAVAVLPQVGSALLLMAGAWTAAAVVALISWTGRSRGVLPVWALWFGFAVAVLLLLSPMVMPFVLLPLWMLVVALATRTPAN